MFFQNKNLYRKKFEMNNDFRGCLYFSGVGRFFVRYYGISTSAGNGKLPHNLPVFRYELLLKIGISSIIKNLWSEK